MSTEIYQPTDFPCDEVIIYKLHDEILCSSIGYKFLYIKRRENQILISFNTLLTPSEKNILDNIISQHEINIDIFRNIVRKQILINKQCKILFYDKYKGNFITSVFNYKRNMPSFLYILSKNNPDHSPSITSLNNININNTKFTYNWESNLELEIYKTTDNSDGLYDINILNKDNDVDNDELNSKKIFIPTSGYSDTLLTEKTHGVELYVLNSDINDVPITTVALCKSSLIHMPAIIKIGHTKNKNNNMNKLNFTWDNNEIRVNSGILTCKSYYFKNLKNNAEIKFTINLSNTSTVILEKYPKKQRFAGFIIIEGQEEGMPSAIFNISKNENINLPSITKLISSRGVSTNEKLQLSWLVNNKITINKSGMNYDGKYDIWIIN